jgi:hypothetical protein
MRKTNEAIFFSHEMKIFVLDQEVVILGNARSGLRHYDLVCSVGCSCSRFRLRLNAARLIGLP